MITLKPWEFPLATAESRAAARAMIENREEDSRRRELISHEARPWRGPGPEPPNWNKVPSAEPWVECEDGTLFPTVYIPAVWEKAPTPAGPRLPRVWDALQYKDARSS